MIYNVDKAKADLNLLNCQIQSARNHEVRYTMQRTQLEAERAKLQTFIDLVDMVQRYQLADVPVGTSVVAGANGASSGGTVINDVARDGVPPAPQSSQYRKPANIPTVNDMVVSALQDAASHGQPGLRAKEVADYVRHRWWPNAKASAIGSVAWRMAKDGRLEKHGSLYKLNGHAGPNAHHV